MFRYQCVIVPNFGAFLSENQSAYYDEKANVFYPPHKRLSFNINLISNDGLLAQHIAAKENISYNDALAIIKKQVQLWKESLQTTNSVFLSQIGEFKKMEEDTIVFYPCGSSTFLKTSFGLSALTPPSLTISNTTINKTLVAKKQKNLSWVLPYAASAAILVGLSTYLIPTGYNLYKENQTLHLQKNVQNELESKIQQATFFIEPSLTTVKLPVVEKDKQAITPYYIIASAFRNEEGAISAAEELKNNGYTDALVLTKNKYGMYPVSYGGYANKETAQKELRKIHRTINQDAWVLLQ